MMSSLRKMWLSCLVASSLVAMATAAGNEYLPPSKGYNYEPPSIPFPTNGNSNKIPTPGPGTYRPTPPPHRPTPPQQRPTYVPPSTGAGPSAHDHHHDEDHHHHHHEPGMPFDFSYAVNEDGNDYSHNAVSDGDVTRGEYRVALPDGRTQVVKYTADWKNGFNAEVSYEGEARYPEQPAAGARAPAHAQGPAPSAGGYHY